MIEQARNLGMETNELIRQTRRARQEHARWMEDPLGLLVDNLVDIKNGLDARLTSNTPDVSFLIPTKDELPSFGLLQLSRQLGMAKAEIVVFSNGTTDKDTRTGFELMKRVGVKVLEHDAAMGIRGGRAYGLRYIQGKYVATLDSDSGPISELWYRTMQRQFKSDESCGVVYGPIVFPELYMVPHKMITLPTQALLYHGKKLIHTVGPNAMFRAEALETLTIPKTDTLPEELGDFTEGALLDLVDGKGCGAKNIFDPRAVVLTDGSRFNPMYTAIVAMQRAPEDSQIRSLGNDLLERMY